MEIGQGIENKCLIFSRTAGEACKSKFEITAQWLLVRLVLFVDSKKLPEADTSTQIETHLDKYLKKWRTSELSSIADEVQQLQDNTTDVNEAIKELDIMLTNLNKLAFDVSMMVTFECIGKI